MSSPFVGNVPGIYVIRNTQTGDCYIGSTVSLRRRRSEHFRWLRRNRHHSPHLQHAWNKYGEGVFTLEVLEVCSKEGILHREQHYLDTLKPAYNAMKVAGDRPSGPKSDAVRVAVRKHATGNTYRLGKSHSAETIEVLRQRSTGKVATEATRLKMSESHKGCEVSEATRQATIKRNKAKKWTDNERAELSRSKKAKVTQEFRDRQAANASGRAASDATKAKMSASRVGKSPSEETHRRMAEARTLFWEHKRAEKVL